MSDNNDFLSQYGRDKQGQTEIVIQDAPLPSSYKYEQKSGFVPPERRDTAPPSAPSRKNLLIGIGVGVLALIIVVVVLVLLLTRGAEMIDLTGKKLTEAQLWASDQNVTLQPAEEYNDEYAEGVIFWQSVPLGDRVKKGDFVDVKVSLGHDLSVTLELPDIKSMKMDEVQAWADANFMTKVRITTEFSDTVPLNSVISYTVNDDRVTGEVVRRDSPVYVVVSKGPEDEAALQVTVPDFKTMTLSECYAFANENGLTLTVQQQYDDYIAAGAVISQSVKAQEKVSKGSEITLVVSLGKKITVPDFSDYSKEGASAKAAELGIPVTVTERYSGASAGAFISQSIDAGSVYVTGDILELKYSLGNKVVLASYVGQTLDSLQSWALGLNAQGASITISKTETTSSSPAGTILSQTPANKEISYKTTIYVTVSSGKVVYVPDFVADGAGYDGTYATAITREDAMKMCDSAGLVPVFVSGSSTGRLPNEIYSQSLTAGTEAKQGDTIKLYYIPSATTAVPDFVTGSMTKSAALAAYSSILRITFEEGDTYMGDGSDVVIAQSLPVNSTVAKGTEIVLTLGQP
jgi:beta-lactam-binding protein with PASTA domain